MTDGRIPRVRDPRHIGTLDVPPEGFALADNAKCCPEGTEMWHNGESMFSPDFRWCHVKKEETT